MKPALVLLLALLLPAVTSASMPASPDPQAIDATVRQVIARYRLPGIAAHFPLDDLLALGREPHLGLQAQVEERVVRQGKPAELAGLDPVTADIAHPAPQPLARLAIAHGVGLDHASTLMM